VQVEGILTIHKIVKQKAPENNPVTEGKPDVGLIQGIIDKNSMLVNGEELYDSVYKKAACFLEGIIRLHPFTDGNKRTALITTLAYLQFNGYALDMKRVTSDYLVKIAKNPSRSEKEIEDLIIDITLWIMERTKKIETG